MSPVFAHGRLRLYLLKLLDEAPRHGYEVIRLLEERFHGLYAPSAGTVYPRLAKLEQEGLVTQSTEGGRKVYRITEAGRAELTSRQAELAQLEVEIRDSVSQLAEAIREDVRDSAKDLREEMRRAAKESQHRQRPTDRGEAGAGTTGPTGADRGGAGREGDSWDGPWGDKETWQRAKEEYAKFRTQAKEQAKQAKQAMDQAKQDREDARRVREHAHAARAAAQAEALRLKQRIEQQLREQTARGDWPSGLAEGLAELTKGLAGLADPSRWGSQASAPGSSAGDRGGPCPDPAGSGSPADLPDWTVTRTGPGSDPLRELERLLDRFRDQVRDQVRDSSKDSGGVTPEQLERARRVLAEAAARLAPRRP
jgi:DNA-binding PadR family transcriptional regulator